MRHCCVRKGLNLKQQDKLWSPCRVYPVHHYSDVIMGTMASQSLASRLFSQPFIQAQVKENTKAPHHWHLWGIHRWPVNSPHKWPVTQKMFPFDDIIMYIRSFVVLCFIIIVSLASCVSGDLITPSLQIRFTGIKLLQCTVFPEEYG